MVVGEKLYTFEGNDSPPVKLYYFDILGKGEGIRRALYHAQINFIDVRLDRPTFGKMKESGELPFGQLPALRTSDNQHLLAQSAAIYRYIGKLHQEKIDNKKEALYPEDLIQAAKVDGIVDQNADLATGLTVSTYPERFGFAFLLDQPQTVQIIRTSLSEEVLPRHLTSIERTIDPSAGPWLAGQPNPTIADFSVVYMMKSFETGKYEGVKTDLLTPFPKICAMIQAFDALPVSKLDFSK